MNGAGGNPGRLIAPRAQVGFGVVDDSMIAVFDSVIAVFAADRDGANEGFGERGGRARIDRRGRWYSEYVREPNRHARTRRSDVERRRGGIRRRGFF